MTKELPEVELSGADGNAFGIMGKVEKAMKKFYSKEATTKYNEYYKEATSGDFDHLLQTTMKHCVVS